MLSLERNSAQLLESEMVKRLKIASLLLGATLLFLTITSFAHKLAGHEANPDSRVCADIIVLTVCVAEVEY